MNFITHEEYKKKVFLRNPKIKELYEREKLNYLVSMQLKEIRERKRISQFDLAKKV
jgi:DNA-binding XRE family transcriptional regulator